MAVPTDPNFGSEFDADAFRSNIKSAMQMGSPNSVAEKATFRWETQKTYTASTDSVGRPYDLASAPVTVETIDDVQVDCAVEFINKNAVGTPIGEFNNPRVEITILDVDYDLIQGASKVLLGGNTYNIQFVGPPVALFSVTVYTIHAQAADES